MATLLIPNDTEVEAYTFTMLLDGVLYRLSFKFNARDEFWFLNVFDGVTGEIVRAGVKVVAGWDLFMRWKQPERPAGNLISVPQGSAGTEATAIGELGADVLLAYVEAG